MRLIYNGPHQRVLAATPGREVAVERGVPTEVPDDIAAGLLIQPDWTEAKPSTSTRGRGAKVAKSRSQSAPGDPATDNEGDPS